MSEKELHILLQQISQALSNSRINGSDMGFLSDMEEKLKADGVRTPISEKQRFWLNNIFASTGVHRDPRGLT